MKPLLSLLLLCVPLALAASAPLKREQAALFDEALRLVRTADTDADLKKAITCYERLAASGIRNGALEYNWGNAYFLEDDLGRAILHWRRAELLIPGDPQLAHNLTYGRSRVPDKFETAGTSEVLSLLFFWHNWPLTTRYWLGLAAFNALWLTLALRLFFRRWFVTLAALGCLIVTLGCGVSVAITYTGEQAAPPAVIVASKTVVRQGDGENYEPVFTDDVHSGTEIRIIEERDAWVRVEFPNGRDGWVRRDAVERV